MYLKDDNGTFINTWSKNIISLLSSLGYAYIWNNANVSGVILNNIPGWYNELKISTYKIGSHS